VSPRHPRSAAHDGPRPATTIAVTAALPLGTPASPPAPCFLILQFLIALAALPFLLVFMAAASWLAWMCFQGVMGPPGAIIALAGIAALAALIRRHTGMEIGMALCLIAVVALAGVVWNVLAPLSVALVARGPLHAAAVSRVSELTRRAMAGRKPLERYWRSYGMTHCLPAPRRCTNRSPRSRHGSCASGAIAVARTASLSRPTLKGGLAP
jgi:hypothetical protein